MCTNKTGRAAKKFLKLVSIKTIYVGVFSLRLQLLSGETLM